MFISASDVCKCGHARVDHFLQTDDRVYDACRWGEHGTTLTMCNCRHFVSEFAGKFNETATPSTWRPPAANGLRVGYQDKLLYELSK